MTDAGCPPLPRGEGSPVGSRMEALRRVEEDIRRAQAEALGRTAERLDALLARVTDLDRELDAGPMAGAPDSALARQVEVRLAARNRFRDAAARVRQDLMIQREALGFLRHTLVEERYPVPTRRAGGTAPPTFEESES